MISIYDLLLYSFALYGLWEAFLSVVCFLLMKHSQSFRKEAKERLEDKADSIGDAGSCLDTFK